MALDESEWRIERVGPPGLVYGPVTVFIAPAGTPLPPAGDLGCLSDERWELLFPGVPDRPPADLDGG